MPQAGLLDSVRFQFARVRRRTDGAEALDESLMGFSKFRPFALRGT